MASSRVFLGIRALSISFFPRLMNRPIDERVLVLAPIGRDGELTTAALSKAGMSAAHCPSVEDLCRCVEEGAGVVIVGEEALTEFAVDCVAQVLSKQAHWSDL